jgi:hypothetical protein
MPGYIKKNSLSDWVAFQDNIKTRLENRSFSVYNQLRPAETANYTNMINSVTISSDSVLVSGNAAVYGYVENDFESIATQEELNQIMTYDDSVSDGMIDYIIEDQT